MEQEEHRDPRALSDFGMSVFSLSLPQCYPLFILELVVKLFGASNANFFYISVSPFQGACHANACLGLLKACSYLASNLLNRLVRG